MKRRLSRIFPGWWLILGGGILGAWTGGYAHYGFSALFKPIAAELGFSRAVISVAASITRLEGSIEAPIAGWATDRFGPRWIVLIAVALIGFGLILMYYVNSLWAFYLVWGLMIGAGNNLKTLPIETAVANWFVKKRGLALSTRWLINGLSGTAVITLIAWLITAIGWRMTCVIGGVVTLVIGVPVVWLCLKRHRPEYYGLLPDGATPKEEAGEASQTIDKGVRYAAEVGEVEFTLRQATRTPGFWLLNLATAAHGLVGAVITIHIIPFLTDIGFEPIAAAGMLAMMNLVGLPLRVVGGFLADRVQKGQLRMLLAGTYAIEALGFAVFLLNQTTPSIYAWLIIYGIGNGIAYGFQFPIWGRYFGRKAIGSIRGTGTLFTAPVGIAAPIYAGWVYDTTGSYLIALTSAAVAIVLSVIFLVLALPPKPPAVVTDIRQIM